MFEVSDNPVVILVQLVLGFLALAWGVASFLVPFFIWKMKDAVERMERRQKAQGEAVLAELRRIAGGADAGEETGQD